MASLSAPPAPPPPPPPLLSTPKVLDVRKRAPADSKHVIGVRPTHALCDEYLVEKPEWNRLRLRIAIQVLESEERSPFANIHPETLQHAAAGLRKTQYREPLLSCNAEPLLRRPNQLADRRHWEDFEIDGGVAEHQAGESIHATIPGAPQPVPISVYYGHPDSLNAVSHIYQQPIIRAPIITSNSNNKPSNNNNSSYSYSYSSSSASDNNNRNSSFASTSPAPNVSSMSNGSKSNINNSSVSSSAYATVYPVPMNVINQQQPQNFVPASAYNPPFRPNNNGSSTNFILRNNVIADPQSKIRQYAMQTPAASLVFDSPNQAIGNGASPVTSSTTTRLVSSSSSSAQNNSLAKELRDSGLTDRQKYSNQFQKPLVQEKSVPSNVLQNLYQETHKYTSSVDDPVNTLIKDMEWKMRTNNYGVPASGGSTQKTTTTTNHTTISSSKTAVNRDFCAKCGSQILSDTPGVTALGNAYHVSCFACDVCQKQLAGCSFYSVDGKNLCQVDYMNSLEKCEKCMTPITQKILRAMGKPFHPECFACPACAKSLDGIPFTVDKENSAYCLDCYHERFSPRCAVCLKAIAPSGNETEVARVIAMDRSYHIDCYRCEDCGLKLNSKIEGQGCYPLENHLFCKTCNLNRLKTVH